MGETYWAVCGGYFLYHSSKEKRWKGARTGDLPGIQTGRIPGFCGSKGGADILAPEYCKGWYELGSGSWVHRLNAGVAYIGSITDQNLVVRLAGFATGDTNTKYEERSSAVHTINGRETYWSDDSLYFLY